VVVRLSDPKLKTLGERGIECIFVDMLSIPRLLCFMLLKPNESVSINSIIESKDAIFNENRFSSIPRPSLRISNGTKDIGGSVVPREVTEEVNGTIEKFKARLVIQGFRQKSKIDYFDIYAPVARISIIRLPIAMASIHNLIIHQMDVKIPFLNGELDKYVYMNQPQGFIMPGNENKVDQTNEFLSSRFSMKGIGEADVILGIRIKYESNGIAIS
ncbi:zinc finger, CCHC-type containing protein, partial [Tanacetum coccineum]